MRCKACAELISPACIDGLQGIPDHDDLDFNRRPDYLCYDPVIHGYAKRMNDLVYAGSATGLPKDPTPGNGATVSRLLTVSAVGR